MRDTLKPFLAPAALLLSVLVAAPLCAAPATDVALSPQLDASINRGLDFLASQQNADGSIGSGGPRLALTGLSLMSFLAAGHTPDVGKYGAVVRWSEDFLVAQAQPDGYFGKADGSRMYGQGIVTLALAEAWGVEENKERRAKIHEVVAKAAAVILRAQAVKKADSYAGGWRYEPDAPDSDISLSGWNALALRACLDAGVAVPKDAVRRAVEFVIKCHTPQGGFAYQPGTPPLLSSTGSGVLCLYLLDALDRKAEIADSVKFLVEHPVDAQTRFPYYAMYYATQAAFQAGEPAWKTISAATLDRLLHGQQEDGGWPQSSSGEEPGRTYATSMALLTLSVPYRLLPIYQR